MHTHIFEVILTCIFEHYFSYDGNVILLHGKIHNRNVSDMDLEIHSLKY